MPVVAVAAGVATVVAVAGGVAVAVAVAVDDHQEAAGHNPTPNN